MFPLLTYPIRPSTAQLAAGNLVFCALAAGSGPLTGSGLAVLVAVSGVWAILLLVTRRIDWPADKGIRLAALLFGLYFLVELLSGVLNGPDRKTLVQIAENLVFLLPLPLFALLKADKDRLALVLSRSASTGSLLALAAAMTGLYGYDGPRLALTCGNPGVLALVGSVMYGLSLTGAAAEEGRMRVAHLAAAGASAALVVMTGMRIFWPVIAVLPVFVALVMIRSRRTALLAAIGVAVVLATGAAAAYKAMPLVQVRIQAAVSDLEHIEEGALDNSIGLRVAMWRLAAGLIAEKPLLGHGPGHASEKMSGHFTINGRPVSFSHYHNFLMTASVRAGIPAALLLTLAFLFLPFYALRHTIATGDRAALARAGTLAIPYLASGLTGLMFGHDILDCLYFALLPVLLYLQAGQGESGQPA